MRRDASSVGSVGWPPQLVRPSFLPSAPPNGAMISTLHAGRRKTAREQKPEAEQKNEAHLQLSDLKTVFTRGIHPSAHGPLHEALGVHLSLSTPERMLSVDLYNSTDLQTARHRPVAVTCLPAACPVTDDANVLTREPHRWASFGLTAGRPPGRSCMCRCLAMLPGARCLFPHPPRAEVARAASLWSEPPRCGRSSAPPGGGHTPRGRWFRRHGPPSAAGRNGGRRLWPGIVHRSQTTASVRRIRHSMAP